MIILLLVNVFCAWICWLSADNHPAWSLPWIGLLSASALNAAVAIGVVT